MLKNKIYTCEICKTKPDQLSHHKTHLDTQKHKDKKELFELKLYKLSSKELQKLYNTTDISIIVDENETNTYIPIEDNKKLINNSIDKEEDIHNKEMSDDEKQKVELSNNVSNKETLKDKIHEIHNYLRNNGAGYGMNALKVFNLLYGLKKIEEKKLLDKVKLKRPDCEFSYLLKLANENKDEELSDLIRDKVLDSIYYSPIRNLLLYEIPTSMKGPTFSYLIKEIEKITIIEKTCNVLLSGKIYEYFIGRDESAISELGAYFTDRHIVDYIYKKLDPMINEDGTINSMIDMFGGSGGFTTGYINYLNDKYDDINWKDNINKIYHFDMNEDVVKSAGLEFFCLTGVLPNMKDNLAYRNSFTDEFNKMKFMNVITNPPYGGDKVSQSDAMIKRKKIKEYIKKELLTLKDELKIKTRLRQIKKIELEDKQEKKESNKTKVSINMDPNRIDKDSANTCSNRIYKFAKDKGLTGNDKESTSLILIMDMLDIGGTAIGVLKEGMFFNKTYKDIRKCLVENFNVREIISVPQDQFENTSTKTSIVIFDNTKEKTKKVIFSDLVVERYTEDKFEEINVKNENGICELNIVLTENKDDICGISDILISEATKDEILKNHIFSLNSKDYKINNNIVSEDYTLNNLDDTCDIILGTRITKKENIEGDIPVYGGGDITFYTNTSNRNENTLIVSRYALSNTCVRLIPTNFFLNDSGLSITSKNKELQKYINYYLLSDNNQEYIYKNCTSGSIQKNLNMGIFHKLKIPIPKSKQKITEWVNKISKPYDKKNKNEELIMKLEEQIRNKIKDIGENEDCDEVELGSICDIMCGKNLTKDKSISGNYNVYGGGETSYTHNEYNLEGFNILISRVGNNNIKLVNEKFYLTDNGFSLLITDIKIKKYIGYYLLNNEDKILNAGNGSAQKVISKTKLSTIKLKIPKNKKLIKDFDPLFQEIEKLQTEMKEVESQYKKLIKELSEEAIPTKLNNKQIEIKLDNETNELSEESDENIINVKKTINEISEKKSKITKNKVKTKSNVI
jgi:type I restriction-modification system DNA methylase subunit